MEPSSPDRPDPGPARVDWRAVVTFYAIACAISWPIFWWRDRLPQSWARWEAPGFIKAWAPAIGPALAAAVAIVLFRRSHPRTVSLLGTSPLKSLAFAGVTVVGLAVVGVGDDQPHLTGLILGMVYLVYSLGEEAGWRGFLQAALRPLPEFRRYVLIGVLWGTWHFTTFASGTPREAATRLAFMYGLWILGSWGMGRAVDLTRSLVVAAMLHLIFNLAGGLPRGTALPVLIASGAAWVYLMRIWNPAPAASVVVEARDVAT